MQPVIAIACLASLSACARGDRATSREGERAPRSKPSNPTALPPVARSDAGAEVDSAGDLVDVTELDPTLRLDIRYATTNNFTGKRIYPVARCLLRRPVAEALVAVQRSLRREGLGLLLWDCYRPVSVQERFWELVPDPRYVAQPVFENGTPVDGSKHNRGAAVDLTLVDERGQPLPMPTDYDDFSERAHRSFSGGAPASRRNRDRLEAAMVAAGFEPLSSEWWHFDGPGWREFALEDAPLVPVSPPR